MPAKMSLMYLASSIALTGLEQRDVNDDKPSTNAFADAIAP